MQVVLEEYAYKVKISNPQKRSKFIVRRLHHFKSKFSSIAHVQEVLCDELDAEVPDENNMGYFEGRHQQRGTWLASKDLNTMYMYTQFAPGREIFLWCDGREEDKEGSQGVHVATKQKPQSEGPVNRC